MLAIANEDLVVIYQWQIEWTEIMGSTVDGGEEGISPEQLLGPNERASRASTLVPDAQGGKKRGGGEKQMP